MNRRSLLAISCALALAISLFPNFASAQGVTYKGLPGPAQGVFPVVARPIPATSQVIKPPSEEVETEAPEPGYEHSKAEMLRLKALATDPKLPTGGKEIHVDSTPTPLAPSLGINFNGLGENGWVPYDAAIAVGPNHILVMTNAQWIVYNRSGSVVRTVTQFATWWGTPAGTPFDPKCFYDPIGGRFVMVAVSQSGTTNKAFYHVSVTQTGDPTGAWNNYQLDATLDGSTPSSNWADFPGTGYDDNSIYLTSNQFSFAGGGIFQYAKIRVLSKAQLYNGNPATWVDFTGMKNSDNTSVFTIQPARTLSSTASEYLLNTNQNSGNSVSLWRIDNGPTSPLLTRQATLSVGAFTAPPDAAQKGTATLVATNDSRTYDVVWRSGTMHTGFGEAFSGLAAVRFLRINTTGNTVLKDITFTQPSTYYYYPAVTDDSAGNVYIIFSRSSSTEFASVYHTGMQPVDSTIEPSALVQAGIGPITFGRWGDYSGIANDPANSLAVVGYAGWGNTGNLWATWVANATFTTGPPPPPTLTTVAPNSGSQGATVPVTLTGTNFVSGATVGFSSTGISASNVTVVNATTITANFVIASNAPLGAQNVTVTTSGGTSNTQAFTVNAPSLPTLTSVSPSSGTQGNAVPVTLTGTNFLSGATVALSGTGVTVSNVVVVNTTSITATFTIAANAPLGPQNVTVTTLGGTSNSQTFTVNAPTSPPTLTAISPTTGNQGAAVPVTLTGTNFVAGASIAVGGTGVAVSNIVVVNSTTITATFTIAANAAAGDRMVTVTTSAGTSGSVKFRVLGTPIITSISPTSGNPGTNVSFTILGSQFQNASVNVTPGGITWSNVMILNNATKITGTFTIAANAAPGPRSVTVSNLAGTSNAVTFTVNGGTTPPTLTSVVPNNGNAGASVGVTLTGTNYTTASTVSVNSPDVTVSNVVVVNSTQITATFVIAATPTPGTFNVTVTTGAGTSGAQGFTINGTVSPPTLTSIAPNSGAQGTSVPVTLTGTNFITGATIGFGGTGITANSVTVVNATTITATFVIAANAPLGAQNVTVTTSGGTSGAQSFTVNAPPPTLTSVVPNNGVQGANVGVTLTGTNFIAGANVGFSGTGIIANSVTVMNSTTIAATFAIAANAPLGAQNVTVTTSSGASGAQTFTVNPPAPTLTSVAPNSGIQGTNVPVTLTGTNFVAGASIGFSGTGVSANSITVVNSTSITATFNISGSAPLGAQNVTVTTSGGTSGAQAFTVNPPAPTLTSIAPNSGTQGTSVPVTLTGTNFLSGATIGFSSTGITANTVTVVNATTINATFVIAANAPLGAQNVTVSTSGGTSSTQPFTVNAPTPPPTLTAVSPNSGLQGTSVPVTLSGTNFIAGATIGFSGTGITANTVTVVNGTSITATFVIASNAPLGAQNVSVTTSGGTSGVQTFTVNAAPPTLTSIAPNSGAQGASVPVTLTGTNFLAGATIGFGGTGITANTVTVVNSTTITATFVIASNAPLGAQNVTVTTAGGTGGAQPFTVNTASPAPTFTALNPHRGAQGQVLSVTLTGTNFVTGNSTINFNSPGITASNVVVVSSTQITATFTIAANAAGSRTVTVTTPGGTSGVQWFDIYLPPTLASISPNSGTNGTAVSVTLTGTNFRSPMSISVSGPGVAVSNIVIVSSTSMTATFTITAGTTTGARTVTVSNPGGTSAGVTFTVN